MIIKEEELIDLWERLYPGQRAAHEFHTGRKPAPPRLFDILSRLVEIVEESRP